MGLKIKISSNLKIVNFGDATLNLNENSCKLFSKANAILTYIGVSSNHTASIVKQTPNAIDMIINRLSSSKNIFNNHMEFYNESILNCGYKNELKYLEAKRHHNNRDNDIGNNRSNNKINRDDKINKNKKINKDIRTNIIWFNPYRILHSYNLIWAVCHFFPQQRWQTHTYSVSGNHWPGEPRDLRKTTSARKFRPAFGATSKKRIFYKYAVFKHSYFFLQFPLQR